MLFIHSRSEARLLASVLVASKHTVDAVRTEDDARATLGRSPPFDALLVEWCGRSPMTSFVQRIVTRFPTMAIVAVVDTVTASVVDAIERAGVHDFVHKPASSREVAYRLRRAHARLDGGGHSGLADRTQSMEELFAWANLEAVVCHDLAAMISGAAIHSPTTMSVVPAQTAEIDVVHTGAAANCASDRAVPTFLAEAPPAPTNHVEHCGRPLRGDDTAFRFGTVIRMR